jgi:SAM-dependent methyltransferase
MAETAQEAERLSLAAVFADEAVARRYHTRAPYAPDLFTVLLSKTPGRRRALDLGCGPGKVARVLADHFETVVAVDPSAPMIAVGKAADAGEHPNIVWVQARAEDYEPEADFDLVTAGASIHWMDLAVLFPKLARWTPILAELNDAPVFPYPAPPCGMPAWLGFLNRWRTRLDRPPIEASSGLPPLPNGARPHESWMDVVGRERFFFSFQQSVEDFVDNQHVRVNWYRPAMGEALAEAFDRDLEALMRPFAVDGMLTLDAASELTWGAPRATIRA